jgi:FkbM family methyltransferase
MLRPLVKRLLRRAGYVLVPVVPPVRLPDTTGSGPQSSGAETFAHRISMDGVLGRLQPLGLGPRTIIDVGAAYGDFSRLCASYFPAARLLMFEPLAEYKPYLDRVVEAFPQASVRTAAAGSQAGRRSINVHPDFVGSSFLLETEEQGDVNGVARDIAVTTIDRETASLELSSPVLLKVDVQGAELEVLAGASKTLPRCDVVILETTLFNTFADGPLLHDVVTFMAARGFCVYDITGNLYRPLDGALMQVDVVFVPRGSVLRRHHAYATPGQRAEQTKRFAARIGQA